MKKKTKQPQAESPSNPSPQPVEVPAGRPPVTWPGSESSKTFRVETDGDLAILWIDLEGEKVNKLSSTVMSELDGVLDALATRTDIRRLLIASAKPGVFIAGADISEFKGPASVEQSEQYVRFGQGIFGKLSKLPQISIAVIRGACMGGGVELALNCDFRLATDGEKTKLSLPEVQLGIFPAWTGTTKLPRLVGLPAALDIILTGRNFNARKAKAAGLIDEIIPDASFLDFAKAFAAQKAKKRRGGTRSRFLVEGNPIARSVIFSQARKGVLAKTGGHYPAPLAAIAVMQEGYRGGINAGLAAEAREVSKLVTGEVAQNLVGLFFSREASKKDALKSPPRKIEKAGVLGAGVMGGGIAQIISDKADIEVRLRDIQWEALAGGMRAASKLFDKQVARKRIRPYDGAKKLAQITTTTDWSGFKRVDVAVEAVVENLEVKKKVLAEFEQFAGENAIFATNTSTIPIGLIAAEAKRPQNVAGMHFFNPVDKMPLVEVIRGPKTSDATLATVAEFARRLGKTVVHCKDAPGFIVNRILGPYMAEALSLLREGWSVESVDRAMLEFGMPMGPIHLLDEVGIDVAAKAAHILAEAFPDRMEAPAPLDALVADGRLGRKNGKGLYVWKAGKKAGPDRNAWRVLGVRPTKDPKAPVAPLAERMVFAMLNEAARILDGKIVASASELDLAMIFGTGFPPFRGGLARYGDSLGIAAVVTRMGELESSAGPRFAPADSLKRIADAGSSLYATYPAKG